MTELERLRRENRILRKAVEEIAAMEYWRGTQMYQLAEAAIKEADKPEEDDQ